MRSAVILVLALLAAPAARADDRYASPFTPAWAAPQLSVTPEDGAPGTEVVIRGAKFHDGVSVYLGDVPMQIVRSTEREIVAVVPYGIRRDDYIYVIDPTGRARTAQLFRVWSRPPPFRAGPPYARPARGLSIEPGVGAPGTTIVIRGDFGRFAEPYYGDQPMVIARRGRGLIVAVVPADARRDEYITILDRGAQRVSSQPFELRTRRGPGRNWRY